MTIAPPTWRVNDVNSPRECARRVREWLTSDELLELVAREDFPLPAPDSPSFSSRLKEFAESHWDFRAGRERNQLDKSLLRDPTENECDLFASLGMVESSSPSPLEHDSVVVLGGLLRGCLSRAHFAIDVVRNHASSNAVIALTSLRPLTPEELRSASQIGVTGLQTEFDAMVEGCSRAMVPGFDLTPIDITSFSDLVTRETVLRGTDGVTVDVIAAASPDPSRRANTRDTYNAWLRRPTASERPVSALLVTTQIYVPYQNAVAVDSLGIEYGLSVETSGVPNAYVSDDLPIPQVFSLSHFLQETRSAILALVQLEDSLKFLVP